MYVVIKECGEYSYFHYEIIGYFTNEEQAKYAVELLEYEKSLQAELDTINCGWRESCEYIIQTVSDGSEMLNIQDKDALCREKEKLQDTYKDKIEQAKQNRAIKEKHKMEHDKKVKQERKEYVLEFWEWWNKGKEIDPYFDEKKQAKIREILPIMFKYLGEEYHSREMGEWFKTHWKGQYRLV